MQIKRFEAKNMTMALRLIKEELGPDAVILSARSLRKGSGFFGSMKYAGVEVTAAIDNHRLPMRRTKFVERKSTYPNRERNGLQYAYRVQKRESSRSRSYSRQTQIDRQRPKTENSIEPGENHNALSSFYQLILAQEVDRSIASELIEGIKHLPAPLENLTEQDFKTHFITNLEEIGVVVDRQVFAAGNQRIAAFVGSAGVGKTTTMAKLAALQSRRYKKRVAMITIDNYGITAIKQLKTYAQIIGVPFETAVSVVELKRSIKKFKDREIIMIDTPGINPHNHRLIHDLKLYFSKVSGLQIHLVLSATTKEKDLIAVTKAFKDLNIHRLLFTKIDESSTYGNMINLLIRTNIPLSFISYGRKVPDDIQAGTIEILVDLLFQSQSDKRQQPKGSSQVPGFEATNLDILPAVKNYFVAN
jgi:flagellar biosynthesis protein FlhF